jgi:hypothetical protein
VGFLLREGTVDLDTTHIQVGSRVADPEPYSAMREAER